MIQEIFEEDDIPVAEFENIGLSKDGRISLAEYDLKAADLTSSSTPSTAK
jgi:hypothetical protein